MNPPPAALARNENLARALWIVVPALVASIMSGSIVLGCAFAGVALFVARPLPVPALLLGAWLLVAAIALISPTNRAINPDELLHAVAAHYYIDHWLPPRVDSPDIANTYSAYGASYLNELDVAYLLAAKVGRFWATHGFDEVTSLRMFNVLLFGLLVLVASVSKRSWPTCAVVLITPQIWYVFAYFNADAFGLFLSLIVTMLSAAPDSAVSRFIERSGTSVAALGTFAVALGLLLLSKKNYLPVPFIATLVLALRHLGLGFPTALIGCVGVALLILGTVAGPALAYMLPIGDHVVVPGGIIAFVVFAARASWTALRRPELRSPLLRISSLLAFAVVVALPRLMVDLEINGSPANKSVQMAEAAEKYAAAEYKPSTLANDPQNSYRGLGLASKGVTFSELIGSPYEWWGRTWHSLFGVYGYLLVFAPTPLYYGLAITLLGLCVGIGTWAFRHPDSRSTLGICVAGIGLVLLASIVHSWANDLQGQGRYLFPGFAMIAMYLQAQPAILKNRTIAVSLAGAFVLSALSIVTVALPAFTGRY